MEWLKSLFVEHSALQAVVVISLISTIGIALGRIRIFGISLGVAFIFFAGILAGHFGLSIDPAMLNYAESFGLIIFVYALGLQVGPGFFNSLRADGLRLMSPALAVVLLGTGLAVAMSYTLHVSMPDMSGILCGATTNTPALGAAQQALQQMGVDSSGAALSCAVTYPLGVVGVILAIVFIRKLFVRPADMPEPDAEHRKNVFIASYHLTNPAVFGKSVHEIAAQSHHHFVISRVWREGKVSIPTSDKTLQKDDVILVITTPGEADALRLIFGEQEQKDWNTENIDWNAPYMRALGLGDRLPVASEEKYLNAWQEMGFPPETVALAYDKTVLKCHELKWPYCNGILKRWHEAGLHTPEEIERADKPPAKQPTQSAGDAWKYV